MRGGGEEKGTCECEGREKDKCEGRGKGICECVCVWRGGEKRRNITRTP